MKPKRSTEEWRSGACGLAFVVALREKVEDVICMARQRPGFSFYAKKMGLLWSFWLIDWLFLSFLSFFFLFTYASYTEWMNEWSCSSRSSFLHDPTTLSCLPGCLRGCLVRQAFSVWLSAREGGARGGARHNMKHTASMWHVYEEREREEQRSNSEKLRSKRWEVRSILSAKKEISALRT